MKRLNFLMFVIMLSALFTSCTIVESGHKGVEVSWGETNLNKVYSEGVHYGLRWMSNDMIEYDVREQTLVQVFEFNDKNNMVTSVEISLDYVLIGDKVNLLHTKIADVKTKILKTLKSAGKEVIPQYSAVELNISKRTEAEQKLFAIINAELPDFFVSPARIQMTDVDIPKAVSDLATETAVQLGKNELALKKEAEQSALAKAKIAQAKGEYEAAMFDSKTKDLLSDPKMLRLKELEIEQTWANKGISKYGSNNVFGAGTTVIKGLN